MKKNKLKAMTIILASTLLLAGCGGGNKKDAADNKNNKDKETSSKVLSVMEQSEIGTMDSLFSQDEPSITAQSNVFEGLYQLDKEDNVVLGVAKEDPEISEDGTTYTIKLKEDTKWSNGDTVTANDFIFAWKRLADPKNSANYSFLMDGTFLNGTAIINGEKQPDELGVKAIDDYTIEIQLEKPIPYLPSLLTFSPFFPQNEKYVTEKGDKYGTTSELIVSNGAFLMKDWDQSSLNWKLVKNPDYFDADKVKSDEIKFQVLKENGTAFDLYESGKLDVAILTGNYAQQNADNPDFMAIPKSFVTYFKMNQVRKGEPSIFSNINVRKAVSYAVDKKSLVNNILADGSKEIHGFIPRGFVANPETKVDFRKEAGDFGKTDKKLAKEYWKKAQDEIDGKIEIELLTNDTEGDKKVAEYIQGQLEEALPGLKLNIKAVPKNSSIALTKSSDYELCIGQWGPDYQDPMSFLFNLLSGNNSNYSSEKYDKLIDQAINEYANEPAKRWQTLIEAEKVLVEEDAAIVPIYQAAQAQLQKSNVKDIYAHKSGPPFTYKTAYKE